MSSNWSRIRRILAICAGLGITIFSLGCKEKPQPQLSLATDPTEVTNQPVLRPVNPDDSESAQEQTRLAAISAMRRGDPPPPPLMKLRGGEIATPEVLEAYNLELLRARIQERRSPESLEELTQKWIRIWKLLPRLPSPPPGHRIIYDDTNCIIKLESR